MEELGGYIEFEHYHLPMLHDKAIALNCGRNCLIYLIHSRKIKKILLPKLICKSIIKTCLKEKVEIRYYSIDEKFTPQDIVLEKDEWIYLINFYGQLSNKEIEDLYNKYRYVIVDQAHAYFQMPIKGIDTLYTCRKFFGVSDGAFLYTDSLLEKDFEQDVSYQRMNFLLGRYERTATEFYKEYIINNEIFEDEPIKWMSKLTKNLLSGIDYKKVKKSRTYNYIYLYENLKSYNELELKKIEGAYMYPLYIKDGEKIKEKLISNNIYIPTFWTDVEDICDTKDLEYKFSKGILPLPCDQRYCEKEMRILVNWIKRYISI